jgi:hypothetical protein
MTTTNVAKKTGTKRERRKYGKNVGEIMEVWNAASSAREASEKLGIPENILNSKVHHYRVKGLWFKKMRKAREINVDELNKKFGYKSAEESDERAAALKQISELASKLGVSVNVG